MIYTLENHELKHAVEEMLFHLLPTETLTQGGDRRAAAPSRTAAAF